MILTAKHCHAVPSISEHPGTILNKVCEGQWESEETEGSSEQVMKDLARGVGEVQEHHTEIRSLLLGKLDLMQVGVSMHQTTREA